MLACSLHARYPISFDPLVIRLAPWSYNNMSRFSESETNSMVAAADDHVVHEIISTVATADDHDVIQKRKGTETFASEDNLHIDDKTRSRWAVLTPSVWVEVVHNHIIMAGFHH